jgi:glycosyltransferase involved in cell wall biosynthesis
VSLSVSCIINAYDRPDLLKEAIASALAQTVPLHEVIVVDDHSPHDLGAVAAEFGERVRHLRLARNLGPSGARNAGVEAAAGEVVAFLDDDDRWSPHKIARQLEALNDGYEAGLCGWRQLGGDHRNVWNVTEITADMLRWGNGLCGTTGLIARREALLAEPFDAAFTRGEDWDVYLRLARRRPLAYVPEPLFLYRYGDHDSMSRPQEAESPDLRLARGAVFAKHRAWLGEWHYRYLLAGYLLRSLGRRSARHRHLAHALRHAGPRATLLYLLRRTVRRERRPAPSAAAAAGRPSAAGLGGDRAR